MTRKLTIEKAELGFADDSAFDADKNPVNDIDKLGIKRVRRGIFETLQWQEWKKEIKDGR